MPLYGVVADIREFTLHDGPGLRTSVFLKGCPLCCTWCHNPETQSPDAQWLESATGLRRVGRVYESSALAELLAGYAAILAPSGGGITFTGGEPLCQHEFLADVIARIRPMHIALDTAGLAPAAVFRRIAQMVDLVLFDIKLVDPGAHRRYTGAGNQVILANLAWLASSPVAWRARVPLVPGVTDTEENLDRIASLLAAYGTPPPVDLLPYNRAAGGKYAGLGMRFAPGFDETRAVNVDTAPFTRRGLSAQIVGAEGVAL